MPSKFPACDQLFPDCQVPGTPGFSIRTLMDIFNGPINQPGNYSSQNPKSDHRRVIPQHVNTVIGRQGIEASSKNISSVQLVHANVNRRSDMSKVAVIEGPQRMAATSVSRDDRAVDVEHCDSSRVQYRASQNVGSKNDNDIGLFRSDA